ncbi:MAG: hypothetical protein IT379_37290 [Deltaproteobacteria bacterium]|nr:hypothetical protein [Deltaproteobacteria bacterium]
MSAPLKMSIRPAAGGPSKFDIIEERVADAVALHFGVTRTEQMEARVNDADMRLLATEARQVFPRGMRPDWGIDHIEPVPNGVIGCWPAMRAETRWLETLFRLARDTGRTDLAREGIRLNPRS